MNNIINNYINNGNNVVIFKNTISPNELNKYNKESIDFNFFTKKIKKNIKIYQDTNGNIVYQDEYEYYGNIGKQQFFKERLKQRTYYNTNKKPEYHEVFDYATPNEIYVNEKSTSTIYDNTKKQIGYRYYANTHENIKHDTFFTVLENKQNNRYDILEKDSNPYYTNINNEDITQEKNIIEENENNKEIAIQEVITQKKQIEYIGIINKIIVDKLNERDGY